MHTTTMDAATPIVADLIGNVIEASRARDPQLEVAAVNELAAAYGRLLAEIDTLNLMLAACRPRGVMN